MRNEKHSSNLILDSAPQKHFSKQTNKQSVNQLVLLHLFDWNATFAFQWRALPSYSALDNVPFTLSFEFILIGRSMIISTFIFVVVSVILPSLWKLKTFWKEYINERFSITVEYNMAHVLS